VSSSSTPQRAFSSAAASQSVVSLILSDHRKAEQLFEKYHATREAAAKQKHAWALIKEISVHGAKEEMSIYPYMKKHMPETAQKIDHSIKEHQTLKEDLAALDQLTVEDPAFDATIQRVWTDLTHHIKEEESDVLPKLEQKATAAELVSLGETFSRAEMIAPTRPHPNAPAEGAAAVAANMGAKVVDAMRDAKREQDKKDL
jgi:hemerythrin superfamily protein